MLHSNPAAVENEISTSTIRFYAPIDGFVKKEDVSNRNYDSAADVIMEIIDMDHIHLELSVFEKGYPFT